MRAGRLVAGLLCLTSLAALTPSARAGLFSDDQARQSIEQLRGRIDTLAQRADTLNANQLDFANQLEAIRADLAKLHGQLEVVSHDLDAAQKRQKDFYIDLDTRLRKLEPQAPADASGAPQADPATETSDYEAALNLIKTGKYKDAAAAFDAFLAARPQSSLRGSATYWGAYANAQAGDQKKAADMFGRFAASWPNDERAPNALEAQVKSLDALKDSKTSHQVLQTLADKYPDSEAGKRAKQRLKPAGKKK
jgi:tol-pal system protein YbgF